MEAMNVPGRAVLLTWAVLENGFRKNWNFERTVRAIIVQLRLQISQIVKVSYSHPKP